jgi:hypothetical protein
VNEPWIEQQIRAGMERGEFDDLPGKGRPLDGIAPGADVHRDEDWWLKAKLRRERLSYLPPTLAAVRKEPRRSWVRRDAVALTRGHRGDASSPTSTNAYAINRRARRRPTVDGHAADEDAVVAQWHVRRGDSVGRMSDITVPMALDPGFDPQRRVQQVAEEQGDQALGTDVNDEIANQICAQLLYLEGEEATSDIWLYINSPGGSVTAGMAIYDTMQFISCDVATVCMGMAASMGQFLLTAGAAGKRYTLPNARIMMHQPSPASAASIDIVIRRTVPLHQA